MPKRSSVPSSGASNAATSPRQNFSRVDKWIAMRAPSPQRKVKDCEVATLGKPARDGAGAGEIGEGVRREGHGRLQHIDFDTPPAAGAAALHQGRQDRAARLHAGDVVGERRSERFRPLRIDEQACNSAERHADAVEGRPIAIRPGAAVTGDGALNQSRIRSRNASGARPSLGRTAGLKLSSSTSAPSIRSSMTAWSRAVVRSSTMLRLLRL